MVDLNTGIGLGDLVQDTVTGFKGVAVGQTQWLHGCLRITVQPIGTTKEGKLYESSSFDAPQLKLLKRGYAKTTPALGAFRETGGPRPGEIVRVESVRRFTVPPTSSMPPSQRPGPTRR